MKLDLQQKKRLLSVIIKGLIILATGIAYGIFVKLTDIAIPCFFHLLTGLYCAGCGATRMFVDIIQFDFLGAASHNLLFFSLLPFAAATLTYRMVMYVKKGEAEISTWETVFYAIVIVLCLAFAILRNIPAFAFLAP